MLSEFKNVKMRYAIPLFLFFPVMIISLIGIRYPEVSENNFNSVMSVSYVLMILILWKWSNQTKATLRKSFFGLLSIELVKDMAIIFLAQLLFSMSAASITTAVVYWINPSLANKLNEMTAFTFSSSADFVFMIILLSLFVPIIEEYMFRGVIFSRLTHKFNLGVGIIVSSVIFGSLHELDALGATVFALFCCCLYLKYQNILVPIILHVLNNLFASIQFILAPELYKEVEPVTLEIANGYFKDGLILLPVSVVFIYWGYRRLKNTKGRNNKNQIVYKRAM